MSEFVCPPDHKHAKTGTCYVGHKCRCSACRKARAEYEQWRVTQRVGGRPLASVDAIGTVRRLRALAAIGWSSRLLSDRVGVSTASLGKWMGSERLSRRTAARVARWYDALSMTLPPSSTEFERASAAAVRRRAQELGWAPPLAWDDESIDDPTARPCEWELRKEAA